MRARLTSTLTVVVLLASAGRAAAQGTTCEGRTCVERQWQALYDHAVEQIKEADQARRGKPAPDDLTNEQAVRTRQLATTQSSIIAAVDAVEPDDSTAAATVRRLAGAIKTNPEGTEAGLVIAPFALAGADVLPGLEVTFAALKDDFTRAGMSYTKDASPKLVDVWKTPDACPIAPRVKKLQRPEHFYFTACTAVIAAVPAILSETSGLPEAERTAYGKRMSPARMACGFVDPGGSSAVATLPEAIALVRRAVQTTNEVGAHTDGVIPEQAAAMALGLAAEATALTDWTLAAATSCYDAADIQGYFRRLYWDVRTWKLAGSVSVDLFPRKYGFSPDDSELPNGDVKSGEARVDFSTARAGTEFSAGFAWGRSRDALDDELRAYVGPAAAIAHAFSLLPKKSPLTTNGELNVVDGELPPRLVVGLSAAIQSLVHRREFQDTRVDSVKIQPHLDFLINETLSFRLGVPIEAEIVVRKKKAAAAETPTTPATPEVPEKRALQWTLPVAIIAVLKL
jgi:hypothetical protein